MATTESQSLTDVKLLRLIEEAIQTLLDKSGNALAVTKQDILLKEYARATTVRLRAAGTHPCKRCRGSGAVLSDQQSTRPVNNKTSGLDVFYVSGMVSRERAVPHHEFYALESVYLKRKKS